jgi:hypothetical protein
VFYAIDKDRLRTIGKNETAKKPLLVLSAGACSIEMKLDVSN